MTKNKRSSRWPKFAIDLLVPLSTIAVLTTAATQIMTYLAIRPPREQLTHSPDHLRFNYEEVTFTTSDGIQLKGWFIWESGPCDPSRSTWAP
jgi:hypothetical protein